jgi:hypothetical protein
MNKSTLITLAICLTIVLSACTGGNPSTSSVNQDQVATMVASTLSAMPTSAPTQAPATAVPAQSAKLEDFPNKALAGENDRYAVYVLNSTGADMEKIGEVIVHDKTTGGVYEIVGTFRLAGSTLVSNDSQGQYVLLSTGTYTSRTAIVISLSDKKQAVKDFCVSSGASGSHLFWNDYVIYNNCDRFSNRPWGAGEAPSIAAVNLKTGAVTDIAKSDLMRHFQVKAITGNSLEYLEISVAAEADWQNPASQKTVVTTYDPSALGK